MSLYSYFKKEEKHYNNGLLKNPPLRSMLTQKGIDKANKGVEAVLEKQDEGDCTNHSKRGKNAAFVVSFSTGILSNSGSFNSSIHFSQLWKRDVSGYLKQLSQQKHTGKPVESLPTKQDSF